MLGHVQLEERDDPAFLRACGWLEGAIHIGVNATNAMASGSGAYAVGVEAIQLPGTSRAPLGEVWGVGTLNTSRTLAKHEIQFDLTAFDIHGKILVKIIRFQIEQNAEDAAPPPQALYVDEWVAAPTDLELDDDVHFFSPSTVFELHSHMLQEGDQSSRLVVVAQDQEISSYMRAWRRAEPSSTATCVTGEGIPSSVPADTEEEEWLWRDEAWFVRRLLSRQPEEAEDNLFNANQSPTYLISGGLGYIGRL
eukprot:705363-Rhodomonas_salina.1